MHCKVDRSHLKSLFVYDVEVSVLEKLSKCFEQFEKSNLYTGISTRGHFFKWRTVKF